MLFWNSNTRQLQKALRRRNKSFWDSHDMFGRNIPLPESVKKIPVIASNGAFFVDLFTSHCHENSRQSFLKMICILVNTTNPVYGFIEKVKGNFVVIKLNVPEVDDGPVITQIHSNELILVRAF